MLDFDSRKTKKMKILITFYVFCWCLSSISCDNIDYDTAPAATDNDSLAPPQEEASNTQSTDPPISYVEAELRHHPGHDTEHNNVEHTHTFTPSDETFSSSSFYQPPEPWQPSQSNGHTANTFSPYLQSTNPAPPLFKTGT